MDERDASAEATENNKAERDDDNENNQASMSYAFTNQHQVEYVLRLFVTGITPKSARAIASIKMVCEEQLEGHYELEVIDIYQQPELAKSEQIIAAPTLIKTRPLPLRKLIGNLSDIDRVLIGLGLRAAQY